MSGSANLSDIPVRTNPDHFVTHRKLLFLIRKYRLNETFLSFPKFLIFKNSIEGFWKMSSFSENNGIYEFSSSRNEPTQSRKCFASTDSICGIFIEFPSFTIALISIILSNKKTLLILNPNLCVWSP